MKHKNNRGFYVSTERTERTERERTTTFVRLGMRNEKRIQDFHTAMTSEREESAVINVLRQLSAKERSGRTASEKPSPLGAWAGWDLS